MYMNNKGNGSGDKIVDWAIIIAALMLWFKTADVLSFFAPTNLNYIVGMDIGWLYGAVCATLVEGASLALHFNRRAALSSAAQVVKWVLIAMSAACQIYDGYLVTGAEASMSEPLKLGLQFGVPLVPLIVLVLLFAVGRLPDDGMERRPFAGVRNIIGPAVNKFWNGEQGAVARAVDIPQAKDNGHQAELEARPKRNK